VHNFAAVPVVEEEAYDYGRREARRG